MAYSRTGYAIFVFMPISRELLDAQRSECLRLMREEPIDRDALMAIAGFYFDFLSDSVKARAPTRSRRRA